MKTSFKKLLPLVLLLKLPALVEAQYHHNTISISSSDVPATNNQETVSFVAPANGTATITFNLQINEDTPSGGIAFVQVSTDNTFNNVMFDASFTTSPETGNSGTLTVTPTGNPPFGVCAGTRYYLHGVGTVYNPLAGDPYGQGYFQATISYPVSDYNYSINNGTITITGYTGPGGAVTIPSTIDVGVGCVSDYLPVTSIGQYAFDGRTSLTSVTIPNSVTSIGQSAFNFCTSLTGVTIPNSVTSIGNYAFNFCTNLTSVTIPNSVTSFGYGEFLRCYSLSSVTIPISVTSIGDSTFFECFSLTSITIPNGVTSIGGNAFGLCTSLTSVTIPNSVTSIGDAAFVQCYSLTNITIPNSVTSIGDAAFDDCPSLTSVTIPNSVTSIGINAFYYDTSLTSITIPNSVTSIGDWTFYECHSLTNLTIGNSVTSIGEVAFAFCASLTSITIPTNVTTIGTNAFEYCTSLTSATIGNSVTNIGYGAFGSCTGLKAVYCQGNAPTPTNDSTVFSGDSSATVYYLPGTTGWGATFDGRPTALWPLIAYTANPTNGLVPLSVQFTSPSVDIRSNAITRWNWAFGDGSTSTNQSPSHVYSSTGTFQPILVATNNLGATVPASGPAISVVVSSGLVLNGGFETGGFTSWTESGSFSYCSV